LNEEQQSRSGVSTIYRYDALGRRVSVTAHPRIGATSSGYDSTISWPWWKMVPTPHRY
jgi:UDP-3-O-[3-hydroxymyristoyl] glucosamine N-acyltransferase